MSRNLGRSLLLLGLFCLLFEGFLTECPAETIGHVGAIQGTATMRHGGESEFRKINENHELKLADTFITAADSRLYLKFTESSHLSLAGDSEIYIFDSSTERTASHFGADLSSGAARFIKKLENTIPASSYTITTATALISLDPSDRPSDFVVTVHNSGRTSVTVLRGKVRVKNVIGNLSLERTAESCEMVDVGQGKEPSRVIRVSTAHLKELVEMTTVPNTLIEDVGDCDNRYSYKAECPRCTIWEGVRCVSCDDLGLICIKGKCSTLNCGPCKISWEDRCIQCRDIGMVCEKGRCVRKSCPTCRAWDGRKCVKCEDVGRTCVDGRCVRPSECPPCSFWNGRRCVECSGSGMLCIGDRCVFRACEECQIRKGTECVPCSALGMRCEAGRCIKEPPPQKLDKEQPASRPGDFKNLSRPESVPAVLPPAQGLAPARSRSHPKQEERSAVEGREGTTERVRTDRQGSVNPSPSDLQKVEPAVGPRGSQSQQESAVKYPKTDRSGLEKPVTSPASPKSLDTDPGPRPRPMPEAPRLEQRRDSRSVPQRRVIDGEPKKREPKQDSGQDKAPQERNKDRKAEQRIEGSDRAPKGSNPDLRLERPKTEPASKQGQDRRDDEKKER